ncbi:MAG: helix-turn-helix transcriptional regulator [Acidobacteriaceae bacterium]|nr:helix-turn-helix transcriptional regulator [Acidobacteriaceae bacterium]
MQIIRRNKWEIFHRRRKNCGAYIKLKSCARDERAVFSTIQARLLDLITLKINSGEFTERGLARLVGVSQPQLHNVLKGKRRLQTELADRIMQKFDLGVLDLFHQTELREQLIAHPHPPIKGIGKSPTERSGTEPESCPRKPLGRETIRWPRTQDLAS